MAYLQDERLERGGATDMRSKTNGARESKLSAVFAAAEQQQQQQ
jgi:hypothetical protein